MRKRRNPGDDESESSLSMQQVIAQEMMKLSDSDIVRIFVPENGFWTESELATEFLTEDIKVVAKTSFTKKTPEEAKSFFARVTKEITQFLDRAKKTPVNEPLDDSLICSLLIALHSLNSMCPSCRPALDDLFVCPRISNRLLAICLWLLGHSHMNQASMEKFSLLGRALLANVDFTLPAKEVFQDPRGCLPHSVTDSKGKVLIEDIATTDEVRSGLSFGSTVAAITQRLQEGDGSSSSNKSIALSAKIRRACSAVKSVDDARWFFILFMNCLLNLDSPSLRWASRHVSSVILETDPVMCSNAFLKYSFAELPVAPQEGDLLHQVLRSFSMAIPNDTICPAFRPFLFTVMFDQTNALLDRMPHSATQSVLSPLLLLISVKSCHYYDAFVRITKRIQRRPRIFSEISTSREVFDSLCGLLHHFMDPVLASLQSTGSLVPIKNAVSFKLSSSLVSMFRHALRAASSVSGLMSQTDLLEKMFIPLIQKNDVFSMWTSSILQVFHVILNSDPSQFSNIKTMGFLDAFGNLFRDKLAYASDSTILVMPHVIQALSINSDGLEFCQRGSFVQQVVDSIVDKHRLLTWNNKSSLLGTFFSSMLIGIDSFKDPIVNEVKTLLDGLIDELKVLDCKPLDTSKFQEKYDTITDKKLLDHVKVCRLEEVTGLHTHYKTWPSQPIAPCPLCLKLDELCGLTKRPTSCDQYDFEWATRFDSLLQFLSCLLTDSRGSFIQALLNRGVFSSLLKSFELMQLPSVCWDSGSILSACDVCRMLMNSASPLAQFSQVIDCFNSIRCSAEWNKTCVKEAIESNLPLFRNAAALAYLMSKVIQRIDTVTPSLFSLLWSESGSKSLNDLCLMHQIFLAFICAEFPKPPGFLEVSLQLASAISALRSSFQQLTMLISGDDAAKFLKVLKTSISSDIESCFHLLPAIAGTKKDPNKVFLDYVGRIISLIANLLFFGDTINVYVVDCLRQGGVTRSIFCLLERLFNAVKDAPPKLAQWIDRHNGAVFDSLLDVIEKLCDEKTIMTQCSRARSTSFWSSSSLPALVAQLRKEADCLNSILEEPAVLFSLGKHFVQRILHIFMLSKISSSSGESGHQDVPEDVFEKLVSIGFTRDRIQIAADLCHKSDFEVLMDYLLSHMEDIVKQETKQEKSTDTKPALVKMLLNLRKAAPKDYVKFVDDALMPICSESNIINTVAEDILKDSDASDLKFQFIYMTISKWHGPVSALEDLIRKNGIIPSLHSGLRDLINSSVTAPSSEALSAAAAAAPPESKPSSSSEPSEQLVKCLEVIIGHDFGLKDISIDSIDAAATSLSTGDFQSVKCKSSLLTLEERNNFASEMCTILLHADLSQQSLVPFIECLGLLSLNDSCAVVIASILKPQAVVEQFCQKNPPDPLVVKNIIKVLASAYCHALFSQAPSAELEHMVRRQFLAPRSPVTMNSLVDRYGIAVCSHPAEFFEILKKCVSVRSREKSGFYSSSRGTFLRYTGSLAQVEEKGLTEKCLADVEEYMKTLTSFLFASSDSASSYFLVLLAVSLITSICVAHPVALASLRRALGVCVTPDLLKTVFSALVKSHDEIPFSLSFSTFFSVLVHEQQDRENCVKSLIDIFSKKSETVTFDDVALLAGVCQAISVLNDEDSDTYLKDVAAFAHNALESQLPQILFAKLQNLRFSSFEERMFISASLNIVSSLVEVSKITEIPQNFGFVEVSVLTARISASLKSWQPNEMNPDSVVAALCDHALLKQTNLSRPRPVPPNSQPNRQPPGMMTAGDRLFMRHIGRRPDSAFVQRMFRGRLGLYHQFVGEDGDYDEDEMHLPEMEVDQMDDEMLADLDQRDLEQLQEMNNEDDDEMNDGEEEEEEEDAEEEEEEHAEEQDSSDSEMDVNTLPHEDEQEEQEDDEDNVEDEEDEEEEEGSSDSGSEGSSDSGNEGEDHHLLQFPLDLIPTDRPGVFMVPPGMHPDLDGGLIDRAEALHRLPSFASKTVFCSFDSSHPELFTVTKDVVEVFTRALQMHITAMEQAKRQELLRRQQEEQERKKREEEERKRQEEEERRKREEEEQRRKAEAESAMTDSDAGASDAGAIDFAALGIDPEVFEALPDDMKEEVLADARQEQQQRRQQQQQQQQQSQQQSQQQPGEVDESFLAELPPELRAEVLRDYQEYNRRQQQASHSGPDEMDPSLTIAMLPPEARRDALLSVPDEFIATLSAELQEEAAELRGENRSGEREAMIGISLDRIHCKEKLMEKEGLSSLVRLFYISDTKELKRNQLILMVTRFLASIIDVPNVRSLLINNLYRLLAPPVDAKPSAVSSDFFDPFEDPHHPLIAVKAEDAKSESVVSPPPPATAAAAAAAPEDVIAAAYAAAAFVDDAGHSVSSDPAAAAAAPSYLDEIARFVLTLLDRCQSKHKDGDECRFENFPEFLISLLRFVLLPHKNPLLESAALNCACKNCKAIDMSKQPPLPMMFYTVACQLLDKMYKTPEALMEMITLVCVTPDSKSLVLQELKRFLNKNRAAAHKVMLDYATVVSNALKPCIDFAQKCVSSSAEEMSAVQAPVLDMNKLNVNNSELVEKFSSLGAAMISLEDKFRGKDGEPIVIVADDDSDSVMSDEADGAVIWNELDNVFSTLSLLKRQSSAAENSGMTPALSAQMKMACSNILTPLLPLVKYYFSSHALLLKNTSTSSLRNSAATETVHPLSSSGFFKTTSSGSLSLSGEVPTSNAELERFLAFCDGNRTLLNDYVRENPDLLFKELKCLLKMPRVLEFDTKLAWFRQELRQRHRNVRAGSMELHVKRDRLFMDSYNTISHMRPNMLLGRLHVSFDGEEGYDAGGLTREWYHVISREMFNQDYALFKASDDGAFQPNPASSVNPDHLLFFNFIGRVVGKALWDGELLDAHFTRSFYKHILGQEVTFKDMEAMDHTLYRSLCSLLTDDVEDLNFVVIETMFGRTREIELKPGGASIDVTPENKKEYVRLYTQYKLSTSIRAQIDAFMRGFHDLIPAELIEPFTESELELLISGTPEIDVEDLRKNTEYQHYRSTSQQIVWFWRFVESLSRDDKAKLLQFVTGTGKVPLGGFAQLPGMGGVRRFTISRSDNAHSLPTAHTCFNQLDLPAYNSYETLRNMMLIAINEGCGEFGFM